MDTKSYWNNRYSSGGNSGYGSYGEQLGQKLSWLTGLEGIKTITEIGCGDFNFGKHLLEIYPEAQYTGCDISDTILERNRKLYPQHTFLNINGAFPDPDLLLCVDVLFHILEDDIYEQTLKALKRVWTKYLAVTAYEYDRDMGTHVRHRKFDYKRFGEPLIREVVEEDGQLYFYLFKK